MKVYVILAKGVERERNGNVIIDTKGEWKPIKVNDRTEIIISYDNKDDAEIGLKMQQSLAKYYDADIQFMIVEFSLLSH